MPTTGVLFEDMLLQYGKVLQAKFLDGFQVVDSDRFMSVSLTLCDAGWETWHVQTLCDLDDFWLPVMGFGSGFLKKKEYRAPRSTNGTTRLIGPAFHIAEIQDRYLCELNANTWKSSLQHRLRLDVEHAQALLFPFTNDDNALRQLISHLTAEKEYEQFEGGELVTVFGDPTGENHWLDSSFYALAANEVADVVQDLLLPRKAEIDWHPNVIGPSWN